MLEGRGQSARVVREREKEILTGVVYIVCAESDERRYIHCSVYLTFSVRS